jgi:hypothetical protein
MKLTRHTLLAGTLTLFLTGLYLFGAIRQLQLVNTDRSTTDQSAYMDFTRRLIKSDYSYRGDGSRMPLYPILQSLFHDSGLSAEDSFTRGKYVNLGLSIIALGCVYLIIRKRMKWHFTLVFMLVAAFTVFMFKAPYYQAELLFYFLTFISFSISIQLFLQPSLLLAMVAGVIYGLAYLTKASVPPGLVLFLILMGIKGVSSTIQRYKSANFFRILNANRRIIFSPIFVASFFLLTVSAQIRSNNANFGSHFFNVNSSYYMWFDTWEEAKSWTSYQDGKVSWPEEDQEDLPGVTRYLREHDLGQILMRFLIGTMTVLNNMYHSYGYLKYLGLYTLLLGLVAITLRDQTKRIMKRFPFMITYLALYFSAYFVLYAWYTPIAAGNRFTLALFLPYLYTVFLGLQSFRIPRSQTVLFRRYALTEIINMIVMIVLVVDIAIILTSRIDTVYGGV